jgi:hypothetical protein
MDGSKKELYRISAVVAKKRFVLRPETSKKCRKIPPAAEYIDLIRRRHIYF